MVKLVTIVNGTMKLLTHVALLDNDLVGDKGGWLTNGCDGIGDEELEGSRIPPSLPLIACAVTGTKFCKDGRSVCHVNLEGISYLWELKELIALRSNVDACDRSGLLNSCNRVMEGQDCGQDPGLLIAKLDTLLTMPSFGDK